MKKTIEKKESAYPRTGRIGRFVKIVEKAVDAEALHRILAMADRYDVFKPEQRAEWWKGAVERLETELGPKQAVEVMESCGGKCCGSGQRKTAKRLMEESKDIPEFLQKVSVLGVKEGEISYEMIDEKTIIGRHHRCFCGQVKKSKQLFDSDAYCQCSVAFNRHFFEAAFEKPVSVILKQAILNGADCCEFEIRIQSD